MTSEHIKIAQRALGVPADGDFGPGTLKALLERLGPPAKVGAPPVVGAKPSGLVRIILHWTAGGGYPTELDRDHYHYMIDREGNVSAGLLGPEANVNTKDGKYAAHTLNCNTGSIGVGFCGMMGAVERPFNAGPAPLTQAQIDAGCEFVATLAVKYGIPITPKTVLTHAEVQPTLGIVQRGKWDITWLPGMSATRDPLSVGNILRQIIRDKGQ